MTNNKTITSSINHDADIQDALMCNPPRRYFTRQRRKLTVQERRQFANQARVYLNKLNARLPNRAKIGLYYDGFGELPTQPILDWCLKMNFSPYLPVVGSLGQHDKRLRFVPIFQHKLITIPTRIHNLSMKQNHHRRLLWADELDVIFCPLTAVDSFGTRMGMGGGFYDTTLAKSYRARAKKPLKIGWCYDFQRTATLVRAPWDVPLDGVISPTGLVWFANNE